LYQKALTEMKLQLASVISGKLRWFLAPQGNQFLELAVKLVARSRTGW